MRRLAGGLVDEQDAVHPSIVAGRPATARELLAVDPLCSGGPILSLGTTEHTRTWSSHDTAVRVLDGLVAADLRRCDVGRAVHAAQLRLVLPAPPVEAERHEREALILLARLN